MASDRDNSIVRGRAPEGFSCEGEGNGPRRRSPSQSAETRTHFTNFISRRRMPISNTSTLTTAPQLPLCGEISWGPGNRALRSNWGILLTATPLNRPILHSSYDLRPFHSRAARTQQVAALPPAAAHPPPIIGLDGELLKPNGIRAQLRRWQELHGDKDPMPDTSIPEDPEEPEDADESALRSPNRFGDRGQGLDDGLEIDDDAYSARAHLARDSDGIWAVKNYNEISMGDLMEVSFFGPEKSSVLAVFVRNVEGVSQVYTMNGRWLHTRYRQLQFSIPGWVSPKLVEPLLEHLPLAENVQDAERLRREGEIEDLSVPRAVGNTLVARMVAFHKESQELYRKHADTLDNAHNLLAHDTDLRYGSLESAATTLLRTSRDQLPPTALYTVRQALIGAGFKFNFDRRSHRLTGYMQIRPKDQIKMIESVVGWLREWQDDLAQTALLSDDRKRVHRPTLGASVIYSFIQKAKAIVLRNREHRQPMDYAGCVSPSKIRHKITPFSDSIRVSKTEDFSEREQQILRFLEGWACSELFLRMMRVQALPPLLLQATGLYEKEELSISSGYTFLQEIGTIMPWENRVRYDAHLLLPSSQHSRPLEKLMTDIMDSSTKPNFSDSMAELRHDWGALPVYCIDDANAKEIDDGVSIESASDAGSDKQEWWVHVHVANPTAFFSRDHDLARMARHMGESIYLPERAYTMLPRWATAGHFSLASGRPCLTISARVDEDGEIVESRIRPGIIRNVVSLSNREVDVLLRAEGHAQNGEVTITVGGDVPPGEQGRRLETDHNGTATVAELQELSKLSKRRLAYRKREGGVLFDMTGPQVSVWNTWRHEGLGWDYPYRRGSRTVEGDPVLRMETRKFVNWFAPRDGLSHGLVRECMLLACETAASWCAERQIPVIFRGAVAPPGISFLGSQDPVEYYRTVCAPAMEKNGGELPTHLGLRYIWPFKHVAPLTRPLKHRLLGLKTYAKATSPLRRYGDMILHWQIEGALREEARIGRSLVTSDPNADRSFLPFSESVVQTVITGLQPREKLIMRSKAAAEDWWTSQLMFRAHHFGEAKLPFETCRAHVFLDNHDPLVTSCPAMIEELNMIAVLKKPESIGLEGNLREGDVWEAVIDHVNVFRRDVCLKPLRLVSRWED